MKTTAQVHGTHLQVGMFKERLHHISTVPAPGRTSSLEMFGSESQLCHFDLEALDKSINCSRALKFTSQNIRILVCMIPEAHSC